MLAAFQTVTVDAVIKGETTEKDYGGERSSLEKIDVASKQGRLPSDILFKCVPYDGFEEREFVLGVSVSTSRNRDELSFRLRVRQYGTYKKQIAHEFAGMLSNGLDSKPVIGTIKPA